MKVNTAIFLYKLAISVGIELYKNSSVVVITKNKGNIYACKSNILNVF